MHLRSTQVRVLNDVHPKAPTSASLEWTNILLLVQKQAVAFLWKSRSSMLVYTVTYRDGEN
jgi:hypothetical protein